MSRLAVYVFWEKNGIVRDYVLTYLKGLSEVVKKIYVVVNGDIQQEGKKKIESEVGAIILQRPNEGVDFWAYKTALDYEGESVSEYEEVILCNCSCYGPIYPFSEMFYEMGKRDVDFWGITEWPLNAGGYEGTWILSYFMVFRPSLFLTKDWKVFWENLCPVHSREECIQLHETKFTYYFAQRGYTYDVYCPNSGDYIDPTIEAPDRLVIEQRCPIIKRKAFCAEYERFISYHRGNASKRVFDFIADQGLYNTDIILDDLLATQHYAYVKDLLQLNFILSEKKVDKQPKKAKIAVCFHVYYEDLLDSCFQYMKSIPSYADIYITTPKKSLCNVIDEKIKAYKLNNVNVRVINARGRAESAFLVATKKFILDYDFACIVHDKKSSFLKPGCIGVEFGLHNLDALLATPEYVENIISLMQDNPRLGILQPMNLLFGPFRDLYGQEWGANYTGTVELLKKSDIDLAIAPDVPPIAPMGAMFWFRPKALKYLIEMDWEYEDFPEEPLPLDGSLIHIIERAYPFFAQNEGYLIGCISSVADAEIHITNLSYLYRSANVKINGAPVIKENGEVIYVQQEIGVRGALRNYLKKHIPRNLWIVLKKIYYKCGRKGL